MLTSWDRQAPPLCLSGRLAVIHLAGVVVEDAEEEEKEEEVSLGVARQERLCLSTGLAKNDLSCCWAHGSIEAAAAAAADEAAAAAAAAAACCCVFGAS